MILKNFSKAKWMLHWSLFGFIGILFIILAISYEDKDWIGNVLQTVGTVAGIYLTLIIFFHSKEETDKQYRDQIEHLQTLNSRQIEALHLATEKQIIALQEMTSKQIYALQTATERQIAALQKSTYDEISSFEQQIGEVTNKLTDNSVLLAEILGRELEKSIDLFNNTLNEEQAKYKDLSEWKLLRTSEERERQLRRQWNRIEHIKKGCNYLVNKYKQLKNYFGIDQKRLQIEYKTQYLNK